MTLTRIAVLITLGTLGVAAQENHRNNSPKHAQAYPAPPPPPVREAPKQTQRIIVGDQVQAVCNGDVVECERWAARQGGGRLVPRMPPPPLVELPDFEIAPKPPNPLGAPFNTTFLAPMKREPRKWPV